MTRAQIIDIAYQVYHRLRVAFHLRFGEDDPQLAAEAAADGVGEHWNVWLTVDMIDGEPVFI